MVNAFHYSRLFVINLRADFRQSSILYTTSTTTVARLIYDQTSSNSRNYTAQGVGNNSCCKTLPISADDDDERAEGGGGEGGERDAFAEYLHVHTQQDPLVVF